MDKLRNLSLFIAAACIPVLIGFTLSVYHQEPQPEVVPDDSSVVETDGQYTPEEEILPEEEIIPPEPEPEPIPEPREISLLGVGDNLIHSRIYLQANSNAGGDGYDFTFSYQNTRDTLRSYDITSLNQETMMAASYAASSYPKFNSPLELADILVDMGVDVVTLANNHMFDKDELGLKETLDLLHSKDGITVVGAYYNQEDYLDIPIMIREDVVFSFVAATQVTNGLALPNGSEMVAPIITNEAQIQELLEQVKRARAISDVVVVNVHWGTEYTHTPTAFQNTLAQRLVEAGADVIFGHHPHVIQPVEYITKPDGTRSVVCYSLGNFLSTQDAGARMIGGMLDVRFMAVGDQVTLSDVTFLPVITHYDEGVTGITNYVYDQYTTDLAESHGVRAFTSGFSHKYIYDLVTEVVDVSFLPEDFHTLYPYGTAA